MSCLHSQQRKAAGKESNKRAGKDLDAAIHQARNQGGWNVQPTDFSLGDVTLAN